MLQDFLKALGKNPSAKQRASFKTLPNYKNGRFLNGDGRPLTIYKKAIFRSAFKIFRPQGRSPVRIPSIKTDLHSLPDNSFVWLGHSSLFWKGEGGTLLVDPIFSATASPFLKAIPAFEGANIYAAEDFPAIDCLLITHDHYDHLDYKTVVALRPKVRQVVVPLGVGSHFRYWGYDPQHIRELNWYESFSLKNATITATPALHMSGRTLFLGRTLWASYLVHMGKYRLFFGGDGGYGEHFREIGEGRRGRAWTNKGNSQEAIFEGEGPGPIDLAFLENGQYNENWPKNHMFPEQTVQAAKDLKAKVFLPIHWGKFCLSEHFWNEPIQKLLTLADAAAQRVTVPKVGEVCRMDEADKRDPWWKF